MSSVSEQPEQLSPLKRALIALEKMQQRLDAVERSRNEPIAIIGMGCRFPGGADSPAAYWQMLRSGTDAIAEVPAERWDIDEFYDPNRDTPGTVVSRNGGFLPSIAGFDAAFFGISPREALGIDPQQRLLLEVAWEALEDAGQPPERLSGSQTGVFVGIMSGEYAKRYVVANDHSRIDAYYATGNEFSFAAGRLSYILGLHGPSMAVDTACSSSLVAVHLACQSLRLGECRMALAGGVSLITTPELSVYLSRAHVLSPDGRCKTFDAGADGIGRGEGCGAVVLKRLSDALADGDRVLALIRGSAVNHDGPSGGLTVPNGPAQQALLRQALHSAGVNPTQIQYVEAHGTGTPLGDPIEVNALGAVLGQGRAADHPLLLGSVKTNIGHLDSAAGMAGLLKVVQSLRHGEIPPHLHLRQPSPQIAWNDWSIKIPTELTPWPNGQDRQLAGVSAFGLSGINAHVVLEAPPTPPPPQDHMAPASVLLPLSARSPEALRSLAHATGELLLARGLAAEAQLHDICYTASMRRGHYDQRLAVVGSSAAELAEHLLAFAEGQGGPGCVTNTPLDDRPRTVFVFAGQGAQWLGMGRDLLEREPVFRAAVEECDALLQAQVGWSLLEQLVAAPAQSRLEETNVAQPLLFALQVGLVALWRSWGVVPDAVVGHSVGEVAAAYAAGALSLADAVRVVAERGLVMQPAHGLGRMAAVGLSPIQAAELVAPYGERLVVAAINSPTAVVLAGEPALLEQVIAPLQASGVFCRVLPGAYAFHSPQMAPFCADLERRLQGIAPQPPTIPLFSTVAGGLLEGAALGPAYWVRNMRDPVRFAAAIEAALDDGGSLFVELGPHPVLVRPIEQCSQARGQAAWAFGSLRRETPAHATLLHTLGACYTLGYPLDWSRHYPQGGRCADLPRYPWQRERFWLDPAALQQQRVRLGRAGGHPLLGRYTTLSQGGDIHLWEGLLDRSTLPFIGDHKIQGAVVLPATAYLEMALAAAEVAFGAGGYTISEIEFQRVLFLPDGQIPLIQVLLSGDADEGVQFRIASRPAEAGPADTWTLHVTGRLCASPTVTDATLSSAEIVAIQARCSEAHSGESFYHYLAERGNHWGPTFQGIAQVWHGSGEALCEVAVPPALDKEFERYAFHPAVLDACGQVLAATIPLEPSSDSKGGTFVGKGMRQIRVYRRPSSRRLWSHVVRRAPSGLPGHILEGDLRIYDEAGQLVMEWLGLHFHYLDGQEEAENTDRWLYDLDWQPQERTSTQPPAPGAPWLILADAAATGQQLADLIAAQGGHAVLVTPGKQAQPIEAGYARVRPGRFEDFQQLLAEGSPTGWAGVVQLWSLDAAPLETTDQGTLEAATTRGSLTAMQVVQALSRARLSSPPRLWLVTRGAQPIGPVATALAVAQAPLWGLGRTLALEHPEVWGGLIDLDPQATAQQNAHQLWAELGAGDDEDQVAFRAGTRYVARLVRHQHDTTALRRLRWRADGSYLISGGLGGLGLLVARWMAEQGARRLVLLGRTALPARAEWGRLAPGSRQAEQVAAIRAIEALGASVHLAAVDVSDAAQLRAFLESYQAEGWPAFRGVIHAAGVAQQQLLLEQDAEALRSVLRPKLIGGWLLHDLLRGQPLDFFVLFGSSSALLSSPRLAGYAAGNAFLDALAYARRAQGLPALCIDWGAWSEVGLVTQAGNERLAMLERDSIAPRQGLALLEQLMRLDAAQIAVLPINWQRWQTLYPAFTRTPLLRQVIGGAAAAADPSGETGLAVRVSLQDADPAERLQLIERYLSDQIARVLGLAVPRLNPQRSLTSLGIDSLMAVELKNRTEAGLGISVPMVTFLQGASVVQLAENFLEQVQASLLERNGTGGGHTHANGHAQAAAALPTSEAAGAYPLTYGQQALWFLYQTAPQSPAYNIVFSAGVSAPLDRALLERALTLLAERHAVLRSTFTTHDDMPVRQVHAALAPALYEHAAAGLDDAALYQQVQAAAQQPFDLERGPLLRAHLFSRRADAHVLLLVTHHIAGDLWSLLVLLDELRQLYAAGSVGGRLELAGGPPTYAAYVDWQNQLLAGPEGARLRTYWSTQLAGDLPALNLPTDHPRPPVQSFRGASQQLVLSAATTSQLKQLAQREGTTLFTLLLAAFQVLLHRYSGQTDIVVGSPTFGRDQAQFADTVGDFVNMVVLRGDLSGAPSFSELLLRTREVALAALAHAEYPFPLLVEQLQPTRDPSRSPLFQVAFMLQRPQRSAELMGLLAPTGAPTQVDFGGLALEPYVVPQQEGQFDLTLELFDGSGPLCGLLKYNPDLFEASTAARMAGHFTALLESIVTDPRRPITTLPLLTAPERAQLLVAWNATVADYPHEHCLHQVIEAQVARTPTAVAVEWGDQRLSYRELDARATTLAHFLRGLGAAPGTLIGLYIDRSVEMLVGLLGILKSGAAYIPLDPVYPRDRIAYMLEDGRAPILLTQATLASDLSAGQAQVVCLDRDWPTIAEAPVTLGAQAGPDDLAYTIYTSGSTGKPKGVQLPHRAVVNFLNSMRKQPGLEPHDTLLAVTTLSFDIAGLELFLPLICGARVVIASRDEVADGHALLALLERSAATVMQATPATWQLLIDAGWQPGSLKVLCGGEALPRELANQILDRCGTLWNMYGPTETTIWSTTWQIRADDPIISIGRPIDNTTLYVLDPALQPVPVGVPGELYIGGDGLARGYFNRPELTAERFVPNPFFEASPNQHHAATSTSLQPLAASLRLYRTGDLVRYRPDGTVEHLGRIDHQVKVRGFRIELGEIEAALGALPELSEVVVVAHGADLQNRRLVAYLVASGDAAPAAGALRGALKDRLPDYMIPAVFVTLPALPRTPNGKIDRKALPAPEPTTGGSDVPFIAPEDEIEQQIAMIWQELLQVTQIGRNDNFFDLGGHSLLAGRVRGRLRDLLGRDVATVDLFRYPTVSALAQFLGRGQDVRPTMQHVQDRARKRNEAMNRRRGVRTEGQSE